MARRSSPFALLTILLAVAPALQAADREARDWLEKMSRNGMSPSRMASAEEENVPSSKVRWRVAT